MWGLDCFDLMRVELVVFGLVVFVLVVVVGIDWQVELVVVVVVGG